MSAEYANLPDIVQREAQGFADVNIAWLGKVLVMAGAVEPEDSEARARAIFAAVSGAQLYARSRSDVAQFDSLIETYRASGLLPG
jgi:TetR/AcrR family transcriptional repressor of nem operon